MSIVADANEIKHLVCFKCGWGLPLVPSQKFIQLEKEFRKQHEGHSLCVLTTAELHELGVKRAELRKYFSDFGSFPYPYIYQPPEPPNEIDPALVAQSKIPQEKEEHKKELDCPYCVYKIPQGQKYCPICGKDVF